MQDAGGYSPYLPLCLWIQVKSWVLMQFKSKPFGLVKRGLRTGQWGHVDSLLFFSWVDGKVGVSNFVFSWLRMYSYFVWFGGVRDEDFYIESTENGQLGKKIFTAFFIPRAKP